MQRGIIAAGHEVTANAAAEVMSSGGNAFDGICAAFAAASVAEPVLASLGGGGFLLARPAGAEPVALDFFVQTPAAGPDTDSVDFYPIFADFGDAKQEFHIGWGSVATPGAIAGLFEIQRRFCRLPVADLLAPAVCAAHDGVVITPFQHRLAQIVEPILRDRPDGFRAYASPTAADRLAEPGETVRQPELAEALLELSREGPGLLHGGDWGRRLIAQARSEGGVLRADDLGRYRVEQRQPLRQQYRDAMLYLNPPPAYGGILIALTLMLLEQTVLSGHPFGGLEQRERLVTALQLTQEARGHLDAWPPAAIPAPLVEGMRAQMRERFRVHRGTTQISIADMDGNLASLTLSNGEGAARLLPGTGIMLNNMLGEADLNPGGLGGWPLDRRLSSMMCPTLVHQCGLQTASGQTGPGWTVTGSAGSNRIRSAIVQVLSNLIDHGMPLHEAVQAPRLHVENGVLSIEPPVTPKVLEGLRQAWPALHAWSERSVFFGGAHSVSISDDGELAGAGDDRRGGVVRHV
jgi:gamma-glutamyltranspeptidase/glutathione hydrolase